MILWTCFQESKTVWASTSHSVSKELFTLLFILCAISSCRVKSILVKVPCALETNVPPAVVGQSILCMSLR